MSPWLLAILIDLFLYIFRQVWYWVPIWGGRARGERRPRTPSLENARRRTLSLAEMMGSASPGRVRETSMRQRRERNTSQRNLDEAVDEGQVTSGVPAA